MKSVILDIALHWKHFEPKFEKNKLYYKGKCQEDHHFRPYEA